ncbi:chemotaxis protein CheW [Frateuria sp.]|uniref:chemotaxis protein CheW n=1 Tax=Frateuria sp. TaxID=2211372 RepID=UPI0018508504|nr:chemotaxis protein CheW [Frateuria sp.]NUR23413.1 purine-binding chemotaxis protein CheW [Frateuria sp.]
MTAPAASSTALHWLTFQLDGQAYAAPLAQVSEVIRMGEVTPVPGAAADLLGVRHLRGRVVPVLDGRRRLGLNPRDADGDSVRVVMLAHGAHWVGLRVDAVGELLLPGDAVAVPPPPGRAARIEDPVTGVLPWKGGFVALLDVRRLCRLPESDAA